MNTQETVAVKPNYYSVIPAEIRYDKTLSAQEKLLYSEITALSNSKGECWASNSYFAELYGLTTVTISRQINNLKNTGYISVQFVYKNDSKEIDKRIIKINEKYQENIQENIDEGINKNDDTPYQNCLGGINKNVKGGINKNVKENITSNEYYKVNNKRKNNKKESIPKSSYGEFQNVKLTDIEFQKLKDKFPDYINRIEKLSMYKESKGATYNSDYATILSWSRNEKKGDHHEQHQSTTSRFETIE